VTDKKSTAKTDEKDVRQERLNAALRANLHKRKQQTRKRAQADTKDPDKAQTP